MKLQTSPPKADKLQNKILKLVVGICFVVWILSFGFPSFADPINDKIENAIREYVLKERSDWKAEELRITFKADEVILSSYAGREDVQFKIQDDYKLTKITPRLLLPLLIIDNKRRSNLNIWARIEVYKNTVVAENKIKRGDEISEDDLDVKKLDVSLVPSLYFESIDDVAGKTAKTNIQKGSVIYEWMIKQPPVVEKGRKIKISVFADGVLIETFGVALDDGQIGDTIKVRKNDSDENIDATVTGIDSVEVRM